MKLEKLEPLDSPNYLRLIFEDGKRLKAPAFKVVELGLTPGAEVTPEVFLALENAQSLASCKERAVRILTASGLSKKELQKRLVQKGESEEDAEAAVAWLEELHLIDDLETAKQLVRSACLRGDGAARAKSILYGKCIPKELWDEALEELPEMDGAIDTFLRRKLDGRTLDAKQIKKTVDALLRRTGESAPTARSGELYQPPFLLNMTNRTLEKNGERVKLTQLEYSIMKLFMENRGKALAREEILDAVWGKGYFGELKIVDVNVRRLRIKIEDDAQEPKYISTVWGYGYKWTV